MTEERAVYDGRDVVIVKKPRRTMNHRMIARRNQAIFFLAMALGVSVIANIYLLTILK